MNNITRLFISCSFILLHTRAIYSQDFHEIGTGFSALRILEINPPNHLLQDLNYYYYPHLSYQYYFKDETFVLGVNVGLVFENGTSESISDSKREFREDIRHSLSYQVAGGINFFRTANSFLQFNVGAKAIRTYFFSHYFEQSTENNSRFGGYELNRWYDPNYSIFFSIGYHRSLFNKLNSLYSLSFRLAWDAEYQFPVYYGTTPNGVANEFATFRTGPSVSLIWRIRGKKNRGLF
jgi:hypothetical protein